MPEESKMEDVDKRRRKKGNTIINVNKNILAIILTYCFSKALKKQELDIIKLNEFIEY